MCACTNGDSGDQNAWPIIGRASNLDVRSASGLQQTSARGIGFRGLYQIGEAFKFSSSLAPLCARTRKLTLSSSLLALSLAISSIPMMPGAALADCALLGTILTCDANPAPDADGYEDDATDPDITSVNITANVGGRVRINDNGGAAVNEVIIAKSATVSKDLGSVRAKKHRCGPRSATLRSRWV